MITVNRNVYSGRSFLGSQRSNCDSEFEAQCVYSRAIDKAQSSLGCFVRFTEHRPQSQTRSTSRYRVRRKIPVYFEAL